MAEKGGKMFSIPQKKAAKSSLKSSAGKDALLKGKDDTPARSRSGKKVQFDSGVENGDMNFTSKTGKDAPRFPKAGASSTGRGEKASSNGKTFDYKAPESMDLKIGDEFPKNVACLMACEAADILQGIQEQMTFLSKDPSVKSPISFDSGIQYARKRSNYTNSKSVRQVLELRRLKKHRVSDGEICMIADVCPETVDEVFALVPSLKDKKERLVGPLEMVLDDLAKLKQPALNPEI